MISIKINLNKIKGETIPFEYNYFLGISLYQKLLGYEKDIKKLHNLSQIGLYTFSNIISPKKINYNKEGLIIEKGYIIFRTLDDNLINYLRLGILENPDIRIGNNTIFKVTRIMNLTNNINFSSENLNFKTLSPILIRNFSKRNLYVDNEDDVSPNLKLVMENQIKRFFNINNCTIDFENLKIHMKTIRISGSSKKESITKGFNISGSIKADPEVSKIVYYKGLGSKTSLGLGCWEVI